jgi:succinyl-CoA synthetase alpha subunit
VIIVDGESRVLVQGINGREGSFHTERMLAAGTRVVAGTSPDKAGREVLGVPVFRDCVAAVAATGADVGVTFVPARSACDALLEAAGAGLRLVVCVSEGIPVHDTMQVVAEFERRGLRLVGPNCPGVVSVGATNVGIMPADIFRPGPVGLVSRSGTLTYEIVWELSQAGLGQSTCVGTGGDAVHGLGFVDCLTLFDDDPQTEVVVVVGEIGGDAEERAAEYVSEHMGTPVVAYVAGFTAPPGRTMGHAGAIVSGGRGTAAAKAKAFVAAAVPVARRPDEVPGLVAAALADRGSAESVST